MVNRTPALPVRFGVILVAALTALRPSPTRAQAGGNQAVTLDATTGHFAGTLRLPAAPARPPVVLLVTPTDPAGLATALAAEGTASLRVSADVMNPETLAQWIAFLRNDERFPTVTVFGDGAAMLPAVVAARAARADGVMTQGDSSESRAELARLVAKAETLPPGTVTETSARIAAFARTVPTLGRRGTTATRPATARRSPRHVVMAMVGAIRVSIEWGQAQKRNREIWGTLVPWDQVWMPGADEATVITTDGPIRIGPVDVPAGDHTLYTLPSSSQFQLLVSRDVGQFHTVHDASLIIGRAGMTMTTRPDTVEGLTFAIERRDAMMSISLSWDARTYSAPIVAR